jgi:hypothetical protein
VLSVRSEIKVAGTRWSRTRAERNKRWMHGEVKEAGAWMKMKGDENSRVSGDGCCLCGRWMELTHDHVW